jgi:large subunit ribosomal protein L4
MKVNITSLDNKKAGDAELKDAIFKLPVKLDILHRMVEWQRAKKQAGTGHTKQRGEVSGTSAKPFAQKGTGRARQGTLRGPHQVGGSVAHGPRTRSFATGLTKKFRKLGLKTALSAKAADGKLRIIDTLVVKDAKTKDMVKKLDTLGLKSALFVRGDAEKDGFYKAVQNIPHVDVIPEFGLNVFDILKHDELVITTHALKQLEERLT